MTYRVQLIRDEHMDVLKIQSTHEKTGGVEIRGIKDFEIAYMRDELSRAIDGLGKSVNISELVNGKTQVVNPKSPDGAEAIRMIKGYLSEGQT